ncbi:MAG: hypothetical protein J6Y01_05445, partial [Spirochaetales bacterium]|nr:hypothetical protein [Spirochaetales bacterium]
MKNFKYIITFILLMTTVGGVCKNKGQNMSDNEGNKALWEKLEADKKSNKPKDVLDTAYKIFQNGKAVGDVVETVSALNYVLEYRLQLNDYDKKIASIEMPPSLSENPKLYLDIIMAMEIEAFAAEVKDEPFRCLLSFIAGRIWQRHLESDYRNIAANKADDENVLDDIKFWSLRQYHDKIVGLYNIALGECMKNVDIADWLPLLSINWCKPNSDSLRAYQQVLPNIYDVMCFEIIPYFDNYYIRSHLELTDNAYFRPAADFAKLDIKTDDEMLQKIHPLRLLQSMTAAHIKDRSLSAVDYINLYRYNYLKSHYRKPDLVQQSKDMMQNIYDSAVKGASSYGIVSARLANNILTENEFNDGTNEETKYTRKKAAEILEKGMKNSPKDSEGYNICKSYIDSMQLPEFSFHSEDVVVPNQPSLIKASYRNMSQISIAVYKVDRDFTVSRPYYADSEAAIQKIVQSSEPVMERQQKLYNDGLFNRHSSHIVIDPLPAGHYVIIASDNEDRSKVTDKGTHLFYTFITATNLAVIERQVQGYHERSLNIVDRMTGQPIENVEVIARFSGFNKNDVLIEKKLTDSDGYVHFDWTEYSPDKPKETVIDKVKNVFTGNKSKPTLDINERGTYFELHYKDENIIVGRNISRHFYDSYGVKRKDYQSLFLIDRAIYRPGQRVYFKCIIYDNDEKHIVTNHDCSVTAYDANRQKIFSVRKQLNEFGSIDGEFDIPTDRLNGEWTLSCDTFGGSKSIRVEEYKRPKFRAEFLPLDADYRLNKEVTVKGVAKSYAGTPIADAVVGFNVSRSMQAPWWYRHYFDDSIVPIADGQVKTDGQGRFEIKFIAKANVTDENITCCFGINANVTDINGETQSCLTNVYIGGVPFEIRMGLPDTMDKGAKNLIPISVTYRDGKQHSNKGTIVVSKLRSPQDYYTTIPFGANTAELIKEADFRKMFPHYEYHDENNCEKWAIEKKCFTINYDTAVFDKADFSKVDTLPIGKYVAELETRDDQGKKVAIRQYFTLTDKSGILPVPSLSYFRADRYSAVPGESVTFDVGSSEPICVFIEKERQNVIVERSRETFSGRKQFVFDIVKEDCGGVAYHFTFVRNNKAFAFERTVSVDYNHKRLDMKVKTIRKIMEPGEKGTIELTVKDYMGKNIAAELAAVLYDSSLNVFASNQWYLHPYSYYGSRPISVYEFGNSSNKTVHYMNHPYYRDPETEKITFYFGPYKFIVPISRRSYEYGGEMMGRGMRMNSKMAGRGLAMMSDEMVVEEECAV